MSLIIWPTEARIHCRRELAGALRLLSDWGARHTGDVDPPRHSTCGTPLEAVWYCPTCELPVEDDGAEEHAHYA